MFKKTTEPRATVDGSEIPFPTTWDVENYVKFSGIN